MMIDRLLLRCNPELSQGIAKLLHETGMNDEEKEKRKLAREKRKAQEAMDVNDEEESGQEAADGDGEVEE
eukprot:scaffold18625_cov80-Skeletonema_menzelii.AAC.1